MSRIGNAPIDIPSGVEVNIDDHNVLTVKGPKGEFERKVDPDLEVKIEEGTITVVRPTDQKRHKALHGLTRSLIANMVEGVSQGFRKVLELHGVGFRANNTGQLLELSLGYSHPVMFYIPDEIKLETKMEKGQPPMVILESSQKELLGMIAAKIRDFRKPEPYKGKGVRYQGEYIRRKQGKTAG